MDTADFANRLEAARNRRCPFSFVHDYFGLGQEKGGAWNVNDVPFSAFHPFPPPLSAFFPQSIAEPLSPDPRPGAIPRLSACRTDHSDERIPTSPLIFPRGDGSERGLDGPGQA